MAEPFVFHFKPGAGGRIESMYMLDLDCRCQLCGHVQFQRFYHSTPFHEVTVPGLERLADEASLKAGYQCENCGEAVGADQVRNSCLTYGFSDDSGLIRIFDDLQNGSRRVELSRRRRLDPQAVPRWHADPRAHPDGHRVIDELTEEAVEEFLNRPINVKLAWRDLLVATLRSDSPPVGRRLGPGLWCIVSHRKDNPQSAGALIDDPRFQAQFDDLVAIEFCDSQPRNLGTHQNPARLQGRWARWCPDETVEAIEDRRLYARAFVSRRAALEVIERTFEVARLDYRCQGTDGDIVYTDITTPTDTAFRRDLSVDSILRRAVYTGLTPGEAARLSAEEIIGLMMQVW